MEYKAFKRRILCTLFIIISICNTTTKGQIEPQISEPQPPPNVESPNLNQGQIANAFSQAREEIQRRQTAGFGRSGNAVFGAEARHQYLLSPRTPSRSMERVQWQFEEATLNLVQESNLNRDQVAWSLPATPLSRSVGNEVTECEDNFQETCETGNKYRTPDGSCNNLRNPTWGRSFTCFRRMRPAEYSNLVNSPRVAASGRPLPIPRQLSLQVHNFVNRPTQQYTHMFMIYGQFVDHDITITPTSRSDDNLPIQCCPESDSQLCFPISLPNNDPFFGPLNVRCMNFVRSLICPTCVLGAREQMNQVSAFIDASTLYGSALEDTRSLRTLNGDGKLLMTSTRQFGDVLPPSQNPNNDQCSIPEQNRICFRAGDIRVNQQPGISATQIIWARQHNRIAEGLRARNSQWSGDKIFEETRRIIAAQIQMVTYAEFLPVALGRDFMRAFNLRIRANGFTSYDSNLNPTLMNEFSTAAYRFGHSLIDTGFDQTARSGRQPRRAGLRDVFFSPFELANGQLDPLIRGSIQQPSQTFDSSLVPDVTNFCYRSGGNQSGLDLASLNIQRGRDHGIPGYTTYLRHCFSQNIRSFNDLQFIDRRLVRRLQSLYESVEDIDLFTGGVSETPLNGAAIGPTFGCIVGLQFNNLKYGDRFYFEHNRQTGSFTSAQLTEIRKTKYSKILCETSNVKRIQLNVFRFASNRNRMRECSEIPDLDLSAWDRE